MLPKLSSVIHVRTLSYLVILYYYNPEAYIFCDGNDADDDNDDDDEEEGDEDDDNEDAKSQTKSEFSRLVD